MKPTLAILVPVFNEEKVIPLFFERLFPVISQLNTPYQVTLVFLDNASTDATRESVHALRKQHPATFLISLAKNVGYQASLETGLRTTEADLYVFIDVDCEDPPEMILDFVSTHMKGYDVVYGERVDREEVAWIKSMRKIFYRVTHAVADEEIILDMAEFSLLTREVRNAIIQDVSSFPFIRASIGRVGFRRIGLPYKRERRIAGETHYNFFGMAKFAIAGILSSSTLFLRIPIYLLPAWLVAMAATTFMMASQGGALWTAVAILLGFAYCGSSIAFLCLYMARTYKNTLGRPNAFINQGRSRLPNLLELSESSRTYSAKIGDVSQPLDPATLDPATLDPAALDRAAND